MNGDPSVVVEVDFDQEDPLRPEPQRHRWLDGGLVAHGVPLKELVQRTLTSLADDENPASLRQRARSRQSERLHTRRVEIVVANLALAVLNPPDTRRLAVDTQNRKRTRYDHEALNGKTLRKLLAHLEKLQVLEWQPLAEAFRGEKGSIAPSACFGRLVKELGVGLVDFRQERNGDPIILTRKERAAFGWMDDRDTYNQERVEYLDNRSTRRMRGEVERINEWLERADMSFVDDGGPLVDVTNRRLSRRFVVYGDGKARFDTSGRLFGGFWLTLKGSRREGIRINGEPVADLDYKSMFPRLAYAHAMAEPPSDDLYDIDELQGYRSGVKLAVLVLLFADQERQRWPRAMGLGVGSDEDAADGLVPAAQYTHRLPSKEWTVARVTEALVHKHPPLAACINIGLGHRLMFLESELLVSVLLKLQAAGIVALPMHDGLLVPWSRRDQVKAVMEEMAEERFGFSFPVTIE